MAIKNPQSDKCNDDDRVVVYHPEKAVTKELEAVPQSTAIDSYSAWAYWLKGCGQFAM